MLPIKVRFGIAGCGQIAPHHAAAVADLAPEAELVAVADSIPERAEKLARAYGSHWYGSLDELLARPDLDAVCICTPSGMHAEHAVKALTAGKHVLIEKPVDIQLDAVARIEEATTRSRKQAAVIFQHRWDHASQAVHDAVQNGRFGRIATATAQVRWWRSQAYYDSGDWRGTWSLDGGGALMNQAIHTIDLLQWIMGPVAEVTAYTALRAHRAIEVEDAAVAILRFESGALGVIEGTTAAYPGLTARLEVHGDQGSAVIDANRLDYFHAATGTAPLRGEDAALKGNQASDVLERYASRGPDPAADTSYPHRSVAHREQLRHFIAALRDGQAPPIQIAEGRRALEIVLAIYQSARSGRPVSVHQSGGAT